MATSARFQLKRDTYSNWIAATAVTLQAGEPGWDITNKVLKIGDGVKHWLQLDAISGGTSSNGQTFALSAPTPYAGLTNSSTLNIVGVYSGGDITTTLTIKVQTGVGESELATITGVQLPFISNQYTIDLTTSSTTFTDGRTTGKEFIYSTIYNFYFKDSSTNGQIGSLVNFRYLPPLTLTLNTAKTFIASQNSIGLIYNYTGPTIADAILNITYTRNGSSFNPKSTPFTIASNYDSSNTERFIIVTPTAPEFINYNMQTYSLILSYGGSYSTSGITLTGINITTPSFNFDTSDNKNFTISNGSLPIQSLTLTSNNKTPNVESISFTPSAYTTYGYTSSFTNFPLFGQIYNLNITLFDNTSLTLTQTYSSNIIFDATTPLIYTDSTHFTPKFNFSGVDAVNLRITPTSGGTDLYIGSITKSGLSSSDGIYTYNTSISTGTNEFTYGESYTLILTYIGGRTDGIQTDAIFSGNFYQGATLRSIENQIINFNSTGTRAYLNPTYTWVGPNVPFILTVYPATSSNYSITTATFTSTIARLTFTNTQDPAPFTINDEIIVAGVSVSSGNGYNGKFTVSECTTTYVEYVISTNTPTQSGSGGAVGMSDYSYTNSYGTREYYTIIDTNTNITISPSLITGSIYLIRALSPDGTTYFNSIPQLYSNSLVSPPNFTTGLTRFDQVSVTMGNLYVTNNAFANVSLALIVSDVNGSTGGSVFGSVDTSQSFIGNTDPYTFTFRPSQNNYFTYGTYYICRVVWNSITYNSLPTLYSFPTIPTFGTTDVSFLTTSINAFSPTLTVSGLTYNQAAGDNRITVFIFELPDTVSTAAQHDVSIDLTQALPSAVYKSTYYNNKIGTIYGTPTLIVGKYYYAEAWIPNSAWLTAYISNPTTAASTTPSGTRVARSRKAARYNPPSVTIDSANFGVSDTQLSVNASSSGRTDVRYVFSYVKGSTTAVGADTIVSGSTSTTLNTISNPIIIPISSTGIDIVNYSSVNLATEAYRLQCDIQNFSGGTATSLRKVYFPLESGTLTTFPYKVFNGKQYIAYSYNDIVLTSTNLTTDWVISGKAISYSFPYQGAYCNYYIVIKDSTGIVATSNSIVQPYRSTTVTTADTNLDVRTLDESTIGEMASGTLLAAGFVNATLYTVELRFNSSSGLLAASDSFTFYSSRFSTISATSVTSSSVTIVLGGWSASAKPATNMAIRAYISGNSATSATRAATVDSTTTSVTLNPVTSFTTSTTYIIEISYPDGTRSTTANTFSIINTDVTATLPSGVTSFTDRIVAAPGVSDYGCIYIPTITPTTNAITGRKYNIRLTLTEYISATGTRAPTGARTPDVFYISSTSTNRASSAVASYTGTGLILGDDYSYLIPSSYFSYGKYYQVTMDLLYNTGTTGNGTSLFTGTLPTLFSTFSQYVPYGWDIIVFAGQSNMVGRDFGTGSYTSPYSGGRNIYYETTSPPAYSDANDRFIVDSRGIGIYTLIRTVASSGLSDVTAPSTITLDTISGRGGFPDAFNPALDSGTGGVTLAAQFLELYNGVQQVSASNRRTVGIFEPKGGTGFSYDTTRANMSPNTVYWDSNGGLRAGSRQCGDLYANLSNAVQSFDMANRVELSGGATYTPPSISGYSSAGASTRYSCNRVLAFLWHQGESNFADNGATWGNALGSLVRDLMLDVPNLFYETDLTFIAGNLDYTYSGLGPLAYAIWGSVGLQNYIDRLTTPAGRTYITKSVSSLGCHGIDQDAPYPSQQNATLIHFSARAERVLGFRYYMAYLDSKSIVPINDPRPVYLDQDGQLPVTYRVYSWDMGTLTFKSTGNSFRYANNPIGYILSFIRTNAGSQTTAYGVITEYSSVGATTVPNGNVYDPLKTISQCFIPTYVTVGNASRLTESSEDTNGTLFTLNVTNGGGTTSYTNLSIYKGLLNTDSTDDSPLGVYTGTGANSVFVSTNITTLLRNFIQGRGLTVINTTDPSLPVNLSICPLYVSYNASNVPSYNIGNSLSTRLPLIANMHLNNLTNRNLPSSTLNATTNFPGWDAFTPNPLSGNAMETNKIFSSSQNTQLMIVGMTQAGTSSNWSGPTTTISTVTYLICGRSVNDNTNINATWLSTYFPGAAIGTWTGSNGVGFLFNRVFYKGALYAFFGRVQASNFSQTPTGSTGNVTATLNNPYPAGTGTAYNRQGQTNSGTGSASNFGGLQYTGIAFSTSAGETGNAPGTPTLRTIIGLTRNGYTSLQDSVPYFFIQNTGCGFITQLRNLNVSTQYTISYYISTRARSGTTQLVPVGPRVPTSIDQYQSGGDHLLLTNPLPVRIYTISPVTIGATESFTNSPVVANNNKLPIGQNIYFDCPPSTIASRYINNTDEYLVSNYRTVIASTTYPNLTTSFMHNPSQSWNGKWTRMEFSFTTPDTGPPGGVAYLQFGPLPIFRADYTGTYSAASNVQFEFINSCINFGGFSCRMTS